MAQHDYVLDNQSAANFRADVNGALAAIASLNAGTSAPSPTHGGMLWFRSDNKHLKIRNAANTAWTDLCYLNASNEVVWYMKNLRTTSAGYTFRDTDGNVIFILGLDGTITQGGSKNLLATQTQAEAGTAGNTLMTPLRVKQAITANVQAAATAIYTNASGAALPPLGSTPLEISLGTSGDLDLFSLIYFEVMVQTTGNIIQKRYATFAISAAEISAATTPPQILVHHFSLFAVSLRRSTNGQTLYLNHGGTSSGRKLLRIWGIK